MDFREFQRQLFAAGAQRGYDAMEVYYRAALTFRIQVQGGEVEEYTIAQDGGAQFRGLIEGRLGAAYTEALDEAAIGLLLRAAAESGRPVAESETLLLWDEVSEESDDQAFYAPELEAVDPRECIALLQEIERTALAADERIERATAFMQVQSVERGVAHSRGLVRFGQSNMAEVSLALALRDGESMRSAVYGAATRNLREIDPKRIAREAVQEGIVQVGASPVPAGTYPAIFRHTAASTLLSVFSPKFTGEAMLGGASRFAGLMGEQVAGAAVTLVDDPLAPEGLMSRSFDDEGAPARRMVLVEQGVLRGLLHNQQSGRAMGAESTGHGYRPGYKGAVTTAPTNLYIQPGSHTFSDLMAEMGDGLVITEVKGLHVGVRFLSGDFQLPARGFLVRRGRPAQPVDGIMVQGNFYDLLRQVQAVGDDLEGVYGSPSLLVGRVQVAVM